MWTTYLIFTNKTLCVASNFCTAFPTDISIITKQKFLHNVIKTPFYVTTHNNQAISKRLVDSLLSQVWYTIIEQQSMLTNKTFKEQEHQNLKLLPTGSKADLCDSICLPMVATKNNKSPKKVKRNSSEKTIENFRKTKENCKASWVNPEATPRVDLCNLDLSLGFSSGVLRVYLRFP